MAIERMKKIALFALVKDTQRLLDWLYREGEIHLSHGNVDSPEWVKRFRPLEVESEEYLRAIEREINVLTEASKFLRQFVPAKENFLDGIFSAKKVIERDELEEIVKTTTADSVSPMIEEFRSEYGRVLEAEKSLIAEKNSVLPFSTLSVAPIRLKALKWVGLTLFRARTPVFEVLMQDDEIISLCGIEKAQETESEVLFWVASPQKRREEIISKITTRYSVKEVPLVSTPVEPSVTIKRINARLLELNAEREEIVKRIVEKMELADRIDIAIAYYESELRRAELTRLFLSSKRILACRGYIRKSRVENFLSRLKKEFPSVGVDISDPVPGEDVPVFIKLNPLLKPMQLLINMFGLPNYWTFDPTAFITFTFLVFFGICFGDVVYGAMLVVLAYLLERRYKKLVGLKAFFRLFLYAGISTMVFGALTGSIASDFVDRKFLDIIGLGSVVSVLRKFRTYTFDPLKFPLVALGMALGIGVINQLYGIVMRFLRDVIMGRLIDALCDGLTWIVYLVGFSLIGVALGVGASDYVIRVGIVMTIVGAVSLVLTQGRKEKGLLGKAINGLVSLYGILGTYGTASFIGDVLSYSRLLALALTTGIVGMAFNIIAELALDQIPIRFLALPAAFLVVAFGHIFNFAMSIMSAFVHSARLIFLEFFGRFYETGGMRFSPFGFVNSKVELKS